MFIICQNGFQVKHRIRKKSTDSEPYFESSRMENSWNLKKMPEMTREVAAVACVYFLLFALGSCTVLNITVSQAVGNDTSSCLTPTARYPCFSLQYALTALDNMDVQNLTTLVITVLDTKYLLADRLVIAQPNENRSVYISGERKSTIIQCSSPGAAIVVGSQFVPVFGYARNVHLRDLTFQNCGPSLAAAILVWSASNVSLRSCTFRDNTNAAVNAFDSSLMIESCVFHNNTGNVRHENVTFSPGLTSSGGALSFMFIHAVELTVTIRNSTFRLNSAHVNNSEFHTAPASNITGFYRDGGGLLAAFVHEAKLCSVYITNCNFSNNRATYGGGVYLIGTGSSFNNRVTFDGGILEHNWGAQAGGAVTSSVWDSARKMNVSLKNLIIRHNWSRRGAGLNYFLMSYVGNPSNSAMRLENVQFLSNSGYGSRAIRFTTALPLDIRLPSTPEIINCTVSSHVHSDSTPTFTSPFTSQRVDVIFRGHNVFQGNKGAGAVHMENNILQVEGKVTFSHNTAYKGGALQLTASQIKLHPGSELLFVGNQATTMGGAMLVNTFMANEMIHQYNTDCFLIYINRHLPPSQWKTTVSFINNTAQLKGAAIMVSSLGSCLWTEEFPHHSSHKALRWNSKFVYTGNCLHWSNNQPLCGAQYDIATDTADFHSANDDSQSVELSPGENVTLDIKGLDQLNHTVYTITSLSHPGILLMENTMHVLSPRTNSTLPFMYSVSSKQQYEELTWNPKNHTITMVDVFSSLKNEFSFKVRAVPCWPGFVFRDNHCVCDKTQTGILRCSSGHDVYLAQGYWAGVIDGKLVTYFCPSKYCRCIRSEGLPGCKYDHRDPDLLCAHNRTGTLCGQCKPGLSVGLRSFQCLKCEGSGWIFAVVVIVVVILCLLVIWLNVGISNDLRGPLFVFQMLPYIFDPSGDVESVVLFFADMFNFGGPLVYLFRTCVINGMNNLYQVALGYLMPFVTLALFVVFYVLSANYLVRLRFRQNSPLQSFWLIVLFMYTYLVQTTFLIQHCPRLGGKFLFFYDGNIECYHGKHLGMVVFASLVLVSLVIPPPVIVILLTKGIWKVDPQYVGTLTSGLRKGCLWWWAVDLGRRVLVIVTYVFIPDWNAKQVWMVFVCVVILALHSNMQPYRVKRVNTLETIYLVLLCTLATLQFLKDEDLRSTISASLLTLMTCHAFLLVTYKCYKFFSTRCQSKCCRRLKTRYGSTEETTIDPEIKDKQDIFDAIFSNSNEGASDDHDSHY